MKKNITIPRKINIGLDLDGVLIDHTENKIRVAKSFGFRLIPKETQSEAMKHILPKKEYKRLQKIIYGKMTMDAFPTPKVFKILQKLSPKHNLFIISRRKGKDANMAWRWLKKYQIFNIIPKKHIFFIEKGDKKFLCKKLKIVIYIDDEVKILKKLSSVLYPILYNPHRVSTNQKFLEIKSWKKLPNLLNKIKSKILFSLSNCR